MADELLEVSRAALFDALKRIEEPGWATYSKSKVIHDPIWGTCEYEAWEVRLLDSALFQRLRGLRQTGFAHLTYPTAEHSRFQHTLGVVEAAGRIFKAVVERADRGGLSPLGLAHREGHPIFGAASDVDQIRRLKMLVRLAALVHDTGHSVFSHSSERIYALIDPLPQLVQALATEDSKVPGAAEVIVYLLVTNAEWQEHVSSCWDGLSVAAPTAEEWERVGRWVMGQEPDPEMRFLADIISGPLDADKLDYVFRDGYAAGIPVGYDLDRLIATVCVDPQLSVEDGRLWWRLVIPMRGINALEQLIMGRLVLNSYLYHHQKCRAAEAAFERGLAREYLSSQTVLGRREVWHLFSLQDADAYSYRRAHTPSAAEIRRLYGRRLRVRIVEFRRSDLDQSQRVAIGHARLLEIAKPKDWSGYERLLDLEDEIARRSNLELGSVVVDSPKNPDYADLTNLLIPGRRQEMGEVPEKVMAYRDWIEAYKSHRAFVRVFGPRGADIEEAVWNTTRDVFHERFGFRIRETTRIDR